MSNILVENENNGETTHNWNETERRQRKPMIILHLWPNSSIVWMHRVQNKGASRMAIRNKCRQQVLTSSTSKTMHSLDIPCSRVPCSRAPTRTATNSSSHFVGCQHLLLISCVVMLFLLTVDTAKRQVSWSQPTNRSVLVGERPLMRGGARRSQPIRSVGSDTGSGSTGSSSLIGFAAPRQATPPGNAVSPPSPPWSPFL